jgi:hypothetical protein
VGQKSNGMLEQLFVRPSMAVINAAADGSLDNHTGTGWDALPFGEGVPCGGVRTSSPPAVIRMT